MLDNNSERLNIAIQLNDPFDYREFASTCEKRGITPLRSDVYAQKLGIVMVAQRMFPELSCAEAYLAFIKQIQEDLTTTNIFPKKRETIPEENKEARCGGCGGGKVR